MSDSTSIGALTTVSPSSPYNISGGLIKGGNQFLSFKYFSLNDNETANFMGGAGLVNILARVTGGESSNIQGTITSSTPGANLFLINPAGVMFSSTAMVNVSGAFTASTANYIQLKDGTKFYADTTNSSTDDSGLTASPVESFGFLSSNTGSISVSGLTPTATGIQFIAGSGGVSVTNSTLLGTTQPVGIFAGTQSGANDGLVPNLNLTMATGPVVTDYSTATHFLTTTETAPVTFMNSSVGTSVSGGAGSNVVIRGGVLQFLGGSAITSTNTGSGAGGSIIVDAASTTITGSTIASAATGQGAANATGTGGDIMLGSTIAGSVSLTSGAQILSYTSGSATAGDVSVASSTLSITGSNTPTTITGPVTISGGLLTLNSVSPTGIFSAQTSTGGAGSAGSITLTSSGSTTLSAGGQIGSISQNDSGSPGEVDVTAGTAGPLSLGTGGQIFTYAGGTQTGATLNIDSEASDAGTQQAPVFSLSIDGMSGSAGIFALLGNGAAAAGSINLDSAGTVSLTKGGAIASAGSAITIGKTSTVTNLALDSTSKIMDTGTGAEALTINATGTVTDNGTISTAATGGLTINSASSVALTGGKISDTGTSGDITLGSTTAKKIGSGGITLAANGSNKASSITNSGSGAVNVITTGTVSLTDSTISTTNGSIILGSASAGTPTKIGALTLTDSNSKIMQAGTGTLTVNTSGAISNAGTITAAGAGGIAIDNASSVAVTGTITASNGDIDFGSTAQIGTLTLTGGSVTNTGSGAVNVAATGTVSLASTSTISTMSGNIYLGVSSPIGGLSVTGGSTINEMGAGAIEVYTYEATHGTSAPGTVFVSGTNSAIEADNGGSITINAAAAAGSNPTAVDAVSVTNGGTISTSSGSLTIDASASDGSGIVNIDSGGTIESVFTAGDTPVTDVYGDILPAGYINITAGEIDIGSTAGAGSITSTAETPSGLNSPLFYLSNTGIFSLWENAAAGGAGGIFIETTGGNITLNSGGQIASATTPGAGGGAGYVYLDMDGGTLTVGGFTGATVPTAMIYAIASGNNSNFSFVAVEPGSATGYPSVDIQTGASIQTATQDGLAGNIYINASSLSLYQDSSIESDVVQSASDTTVTGSTGEIFFNTTTLTMAGTGSNQSYIQNGFIISGSGAYNPETGTFANAAAYNPATKTSTYNPFGSGPIQGYVTGVGTYTLNSDGTYSLKNGTTPVFQEGGSFTGTQYSPTGSTVIIPTGISDTSPNGTNYSPDNYVRYDLDGAINAEGPDLPTISTQQYNGFPSNGLVLDGTTTNSAAVDYLNGLTIESLGQSVSLPAGGTLQIDPTYLIYNDYGITVGSNLFISFNTFNLSQGEYAVFDAQQDSTHTSTNDAAVNNPISNIIVRITGIGGTPGPSTIDGTIEEYDASATEQTKFGIDSGIQATTVNIYFINPYGIIFTQNAAAVLNASSVILNGGASLTLSTADYVGFGSNFDPNFDPTNPDSDQVFYTTTSANDASTITAPGLLSTSSLGSSAPSAFGFSTNTFGENKTVTILGSKINLNGTGAVSIIAGDIDLGHGAPGLGMPPISTAGTVLESINNQILLFSAGSNGNLTYATPTASNPLPVSFSGATLGDIDISEQSALHVKGGDTSQASIVIVANNFTLNNSVIVDEAAADQMDIPTTVGNVLISAAGAATISSSNNLPSFVSTSNFGYGPGGSVQVYTPALTISVSGGDNSLTGIFSAAQPVQYYENSSSGNLTLGTYQYDGSTTPDGLATENGNAGNITLNLGQSLTMTGGLISVATTGEGEAGTITIQGEVSNNQTSNPSISMTNGAVINSSTSLDNGYFSQTGDAGNILIQSGSIMIDGGGLLDSSNNPIFTGILASAGKAGNSDTALTGSGGDVVITMNGDLSIYDGGEISASTYTQGECGFVSINQSGGDGNAITINGNLDATPTNLTPATEQKLPTGILAENFGTGGVDTSDPLNPSQLAVTVTAVGAVVIKAGGEISSATFDSNATLPGGPLILTINSATNPGSLTIDGTYAPQVFNQAGNGTQADLLTTGVLSSTYGGGNAGALTVTVDGPVTITGGGPGGAAISDGSIGASGPGGALLVTATGSLTIDGTGASAFLVDDNGRFDFTPTGITTSSFDSASSSAGAGDLTVNVSGSATIVNGGQISSGSITGADGGTLIVTTGALTINGAYNGSNTLIEPDSNLLYPTGIISSSFLGGSAGSVTVTASGVVNILNGGQISSETYYTSTYPQYTNPDGSNALVGNGGDITLMITATGLPSSTNALTIDGSNVQPDQTTANSHGNAEFATGLLSSTVEGVKAGALTVDVASGSVSIAGGGQLSAETDGVGTGGMVTLQISAGSLTINGASTGSTPLAANVNQFFIQGYSFNSYPFDNAPVPLQTGVFSSTTGADDAGSATVTVSGAVNILASGLISSGTTDRVVNIKGNNYSGSGQGGDLTLTAGSLTIDGSATPTVPTGILSTSALIGTSPGTSEGDAGTLEINVTGAVSLSAGGIISSSTTSNATAGVVNLTAGSLAIDGMAAALPTGISTSSSGPSTATGAGGTINLSVPGSISISNGGVIDATTSTAQTGGTINIGGQSSDNLPLSAPSGLTVSGTSSAITSATSGMGAAGDINATISGDVALSAGGEISSGATDVGNGSGKGGTITLTSDALAVEGMGSVSGIFSSTSLLTGVTANPADGNAGTVNLTVAGPVSLTGGGQISSSTTSIGTAGSVNLSGTSLTIDGMNGTGSVLPMGITVPTGILTSSSGPSSSTGTGGTINLSISGAIALSNSGEIGATTSTNQTGGDISTLVSCSSLTLDSGSQITAAAVDMSGATSGQAGSVTLVVDGPVEIASGSTISSGTADQGDGGTVFLGGSSLMIDGLGSEISSSSSSSALTAGSGGDVSLSISGAITLTGGGKVSASTAGGETVTQGAVTTTTGNGGSVFIGVETPSHLNLNTPTSLTISGSGSEIISDTTGAGNAGTIDATVAGPVDLAAGGQISSDTASSGTAGSITLTADSLAMSGPTTLISTSSTGISPAPGAGNDGTGTIILTVPGVIELNTGAQIAATTATGQSGGDISIFQLPTAQDPIGSLTLSDAQTAITAASTGAPTTIGMTTVTPGDSGSITIVTDGTLTVANHSTIDSSSQNSNAGSKLTQAISISAQELVLEDSGTIDATAPSTAPMEGNGGNITIMAGKLLYLLDSDILTFAGDQGGNITIDPQFVILGNSLISAHGLTDGNIFIDASYLFESSSTIEATGTVTLNTVPLDLAGSLIALPGQLTDEEKRLRESCARSVNHEFSSLIVVGRGGTESAPEELQPDSGLDPLPKTPSLGAKISP